MRGIARRAEKQPRGPHNAGHKTGLATTKFSESGDIDHSTVSYLCRPEPPRKKAHPSLIVVAWSPRKNLVRARASSIWEELGECRPIPERFGSGSEKVNSTTVARLGKIQLNKRKQSSTFDTSTTPINSGYGYLNMMILSISDPVGNLNRGTRQRRCRTRLNIVAMQGQ